MIVETHRCRMPCIVKRDCDPCLLIGLTSQRATCRQLTVWKTDLVSARADIKDFNDFACIWKQFFFQLAPCSKPFALHISLCKGLLLYSFLIDCLTSPTHCLHACLPRPQPSCLPASFTAFMPVYLARCVHAGPPPPCLHVYPAHFLHAWKDLPRLLILP